jgi:hypothetical protein
MTPHPDSRLAAELQQVALAIRLFGLDALPSVMNRHEDKLGGDEPSSANEPKSEAR